jgi:hypothetical protein
LERHYDDAVANDYGFADSVKEVQGRLNQATVGFEDNYNYICIRIDGSVVFPVLWERYPRLRPGYTDWWYRPILREPGAPDNEAADALYAEWWAMGEKARAEHHDQAVVAGKPSRSLSEWQHPITIGLEGAHEFLDVQRVLSMETGMSVVSDYFTTSPLAVPEEARRPIPAWRSLYLVAERWRYQWKKAGNCLVFHRSDWYDLASCEIPESLILTYREKLESQGRLTLDDVAALTAAFLKSRAPILQGIPSAPANVNNVPLALSRAGIWSFNLWSPTLALYASLSSEQRQKVHSPSGLAFSEMTRAQRGLVRQESARWDNPPPPPAEEIPQAVLRLQEPPAESPEAEAHSYELVLAFPNEDFSTPVTLRPEAGHRAPEGPAGKQLGVFSSPSMEAPASHKDLGMRV